MNHKKAFIIFGFIFLVCLCFATCDNPIIEKWWQDPEQEEEPDYGYSVLTKNIPFYVYETIVEKDYIYEEVIKYITIYDPQIVIIEKPVPPEILLQHIDIVDIEFIIFSGDQTEYNKGHGGTASSDVSENEQKNNNLIIEDMVDALHDPKHFLILHGHANPALGTAEEDLELTRISTGRAESARDALVLADAGIALPAPTAGGTSMTIPKADPDYPLLKQITTKGYGGGRNMTGSSSSYAGLNRRVEAILFTISDPASVSSGSGY